MEHTYVNIKMVGPKCKWWEWKNIFYFATLLSHFFLSGFLDSFVSGLHLKKMSFASSSSNFLGFLGGQVCAFYFPVIPTLMGSAFCLSLDESRKLVQRVKTSWSWMELANQWTKISPFPLHKTVSGISLQWQETDESGKSLEQWPDSTARLIRIGKPFPSVSFHTTSHMDLHTLVIYVFICVSLESGQVKCN